MAIQFSCPSCGQPIEVDDQYADAEARCPYCNNTIHVPRRSTLNLNAREEHGQAGAATSAAETGAQVPDAQERQAQPGPVAPPPPGALHVGPDPLARRRQAVRLGTASLICAALTLVLFAVLVGLSFKVTRELGIGASGTVDPNRMDELQEEVSKRPEAVWLALGSCALPVVALFGLILGIISLVSQSRENWRGWVGVIVCGLGLLLVIVAVILQIAMLM
jgi:DNA-directed RNA polymerase subunit RPC12/RpoP